MLEYIQLKISRGELIELYTIELDMINIINQLVINWGIKKDELIYVSIFVMTNLIIPKNCNLPFFFNKRYFRKNQRLWAGYFLT